MRTTPLLNWLPDPVEWYFRPFPGRTNFTLFPWAGFVFAGAVVGIFIDRLRTAEDAVRRQTGLAAAAIILAFLAYRASFLPSMYARSEFWTSSPSYFFLRVGILTLLIPLAYFWERAPWRGKVSNWSPLETFGRGIVVCLLGPRRDGLWLFQPAVRRSLSFGEVLVAYVLFTVFLLGLVFLKNRFWESRNRSGHAAPGSHARIYLTDSKSVI